MSDILSKTPREIMLEEENRRLRAELATYRSSSMEPQLDGGMITDRLAHQMPDIDKPLMLQPTATIRSTLDRGGVWRVLCQAGYEPETLRVSYHTNGAHLTHADLVNRVLPDLHLNFLHRLGDTLRKKQPRAEDMTLIES